MQFAGIIRLLKYAVLCLLALCSLAGLSLWHLYHWSQSPLTFGAPHIVKVPAKVSLQGLTAQLASGSTIDSSWRFLLWVKAQRVFHKVQAGTYRFEQQASPQQILEALLKGDNHQPAVIAFIIPEGYNLRQTITKMSQEGIGDYSQLLRLAADPNFLARLAIEGPSLEGFLYPATYNFYEEHPPAEEVFATFVAEFFRRIPLDYHSKLASQGLNFYQAVIFASLIEKETSLERERPLIAEVIWRRLKAKIPLGVDAAVIYGCADYQGTLKTLHLKDRSNLYNTRIHRGLPPTPIASPSAASLAAVVAPSNEGFFYYVLQPGGEGAHQFARTLKEHNVNVQRLVRAQRQGTL